MKKKILKYEIFSTILIFVLGVIFHFIYDWSKNNVFVGIISPVNESIWEHLKLIYIPMVITIIINRIFIKEKNEKYICAKTKGIFMGMFFIIVFYYTYSGVIGTNIDKINILSFFIATIIAEYYTYKNIIKNKPCNKIMTILFLILTFSIFIIFTFEPPNINLFKDPLTGKYGI